MSKKYDLIKDCNYDILCSILEQSREELYEIREIKNKVNENEMYNTLKKNINTEMESLINDFNKDVVIYNLFPFIKFENFKEIVQKFKDEKIVYYDSKNLIELKNEIKERYDIEDFNKFIKEIDIYKIKNNRSYFLEIM